MQFQEVLLWKRPGNRLLKTDDLQETVYHNHLWRWLPSHRCGNTQVDVSGIGPRAYTCVNQSPIL